MSRNGWNRFASFAFAAGFLTAVAAPAAVNASVAFPRVPMGGLRDLGRADARTPVQLAVVLNYQHAAELDRITDAMSDPDSPMSKVFFTTAQFRSYFSPTTQSYARVINALQRGGFTITGTFANRLIVDAQAPAPVAERFFGTEIHRVVQPDQGVRYANVREATLPASLRGDVFSVLGLNNLILFHPTFKVRPPHASNPFGNQAVIGQPLHGPDGGFGPLAFAQGYDEPVQHQIPSQPNGTTYDGKGSTAGIVIPADPPDSDLSKFLTEFKVTRTGTTTRIKIDGGPPGGGSSEDLLEADLDYQTISGLAPGANVRIYEPDSFQSSHVADAYNAAVTDNLADSINSSFGACETFGYFDPQAFKQVIKGGWAQGQTFHASTGDSGTATFGCSNSVSVLTPADIPKVTAIGGTRLSTDSNGNWTAEQYWNDGSFDAGGGGVSVVFKLPPFQKKKKAHIQSSGRNLPDVSFDADPVSGEDMVFEGSFLTVGGTSLASPIFGATLCELDQMRGSRIAHFNPTLYHAWEASGYGSNLHDITTGNAYGILQPLPGYDLATGIGSMDVFKSATGLF